MHEQPSFQREINRLLLAFLAGFLLIAFGAGYWAVYGADSLLQREDNARRVIEEASIARGMIVDHSGRVLASSELGAGGAQVRHYEEPAAYSITGYASQRYGVGGVEAIFNPILRGDNLPTRWDQVLMGRLLHRAQVGSDIRLTIDIGLQRQLAGTMTGLRGAAILLDVPSGAVRALISLPDYDPNTIDADWERLLRDTGTPLFNRALQGRYQPGSALQTAVLTAAVLAETPLDTPFTQATVPVQAGDLRLSCALPVTTDVLSLRAAYAFSCPAPFAALVAGTGGDTLLEDTLALMDRTGANDLLRTPQRGVIAPEATDQVAMVRPSNALDDILGQGQQTYGIVDMAMMAAGIINDGNAPMPYLLDATRPPTGTADRATGRGWVTSVQTQPSLPIMTTRTARLLQDAMRYTVAEGAAQNAGRPDLDIGGHIGLAYSGDETLTWFVGFATFGGMNGAAIALILEDVNDPGLAADIGGQMLQAAHEQVMGSATLP